MSANIFEAIKGAGRGTLELDATSNLFQQIDGLPRSAEDSIHIGILQAVSDAVHRASRGDATSIPVFAQQLEYVFSKVYEQEFNDLPMANGDVLPINTEVPNTAETYSYMTLTAAGVARMGNTYAMADIPRVSLSGTKETGNIVAVMNCYGFSLQDMRRVASLPQGSMLETALPKAARRAHEEIANRVGWWGSTKQKLKGLLTHPNTPTAYAPNGVGGTPQWSTKTFDEIFTDIVTAIEGVAERTYGREVVTHCYLPRAIRRVLMLKRIEHTQVTLEQHIRDSYPGITFSYIDDLSAAHPRNLIGKNIMVLVNQDRDAASLVVPRIFEQLDPQWYGLEWLTICHSRIGGVMMPRPYSVALLVDI